MKKIIAGIVAGAALGLTVAPVASHAAEDAANGKVDIPAWITRPCRGKYDVNCRHENAKHVSVVRYIKGKHGRDVTTCVFYAESAYARHHDYCA